MLDGFKIEATRTAENPEWGGPHRAYKVKLTNPRGNRYTVPYHMGSGLKGEPELLDVLRCLVMDADIVDEATDFEEWARDMGGIPEDWDEVRRLRKTYRECRRTAERLESFLTEDEREAIRNSES